MRVPLMPVADTVSPNWRILLVDEGASARERVGAALAALGCTVAAAAGPLTAFEMAYSRGFDAAILGADRAGFDPAALARDLRALGGPWSDLPMVALGPGHGVALRPAGPFDAALPAAADAAAWGALLAGLTRPPWAAHEPARLRAASSLREAAPRIDQLGCTLKTRPAR